MRLIHTNKVKTQRKQEDHKPKSWKLWASALMVSGVFLAGANVANAKDTCTAKRMKGKMPAFSLVKSSKKKVKSFNLNIPELHEGAYIQITLPPKYANKVVGTTSEIPEPKRGVFLRKIIGGNIRAALRELGSGKRASYECMPFSLSKNKKTENLPPLPKEIKGGSGTTEDPYILHPDNIKRDRTGVGSTIIKDMPMPFRADGVPFPVYFRLTISLNQIKGNARRTTELELSSVITAATKRRVMEETGAPVDKFTVLVTPLINKIIDKASATGENVAAYFKAKEAPAKRRRTLDLDN